MIGASPDENAFAGITARSSVARPTPTRISFLMRETASTTSETFRAQKKIMKNTLKYLDYRPPRA